MNLRKDHYRKATTNSLQLTDECSLIDAAAVRRVPATGETVLLTVDGAVGQLLTGRYAIGVVARCSPYHRVPFATGPRIGEV